MPQRGRKGPYASIYGPLLVSGEELGAGCVSITSSSGTQASGEPERTRSFRDPNTH